MGTPDWQEGTRFYLPNEDAEVVRRALELLAGSFHAPCRPLFVTGSGMLALDLLPSFGGGQKVECVDLSPFQTAYMTRLMDVLKAVGSPVDLQCWFRREILPEMDAFYRLRGKSYSFENILTALGSFFHIRLFFDATALKAVQHRLEHVCCSREDMVERVCRNDGFDFVHLSNIVDYLAPERLDKLFAACALAGAAVLYIETCVCKDTERLHESWRAAGFVPHPQNGCLDTMNRGLGCRNPVRDWMRAGHVRLLLPDEKSTVRRAKSGSLS